jgi:uncharacterized protein (TIGR02246 family)
MHQPDPKAAALAVISAWIAAFSASDVDAIVELYAPDAHFIGTSSTTVITATAGIRTYFEAALLTRRPRGATLSGQTVLALSEDAVLVTGLNTTSGVHEGRTISTPGRVSFVIARRGPGWQIVHFHRSAMPG